MIKKNILICFTAIFLLLAYSPLFLSAFPLSLSDVNGNEITLSKPPQRVVSIDAPVTDTIFRLEADDSLLGITYHINLPAKAAEKRIIGGFFHPSLDLVKQCQPDMIFVSLLHQEIIDYYQNSEIPIISVKANSINKMMENILLVGKIMDKQAEAEDIVRDMKTDLAIIKNKTEKIPPDERKRVIRLMGHQKVMTPGDDSFQNDYIRAAGGIPPELGKNGNVVSITKEEWMRFNPQVIYGCGGDRKTAQRFFDQPGWRDVEAVINGKIFYYPCDLTCRSSIHAAYFVNWLAADIYSDFFAKPEFWVVDKKVVERKSLLLGLSYVKKAEIVDSYVFDFINKSLQIEFTEPMQVLNTLEGLRNDIKVVGNHYTPPPIWGITHTISWEESKTIIFNTLGISPATASFLFTGANIDNLAVTESFFKEQQVKVLVTAGVTSNAQRMSQDEGLFYEPGTINIIILTNARLSPRAMTRAVITATEAKTAALQDIDIRSSYQGRTFQATGTGTDEIIVVSGKGTFTECSSGHCKMGEQISKAVYSGVVEAIKKQNGIVPNRCIFRRLKERNLSPFEICAMVELPQNIEVSRSILAQELEELLLQPEYAEFIETAFALSDGWQRRQISDLSLFNDWCSSVAIEICGQEEVEMMPLLDEMKLPQPLKLAFNAILNGIVLRLQELDNAA